jgi:hypothetical protein
MDKQDTPYFKFAKYLAGLDPKKNISAKQETEMWSCMSNTLIGIAMLVFASGLVYVASTDPAVVTNRMYVYSLLIIAPILVAAYMMVPTFGAKPSGTKLFGYGMVVCALLVAAYFLMKNMSMKEVVYANYFIIALGVGLAIFLMVIMSKVSVRYLMSLEGWPGFVAKLILYMPCLITDLVRGSIGAMPNIFAKIGLILMLVVALLTIVYYIVDAFASIGVLRIGNTVTSSIKGNYEPDVGNISTNFSGDALNRITDMFRIPDIFRIPDWFKQRAYMNSLYRADVFPLNVTKTLDITGLDMNEDESSRAKNYTISAWVYLPAQAPLTRILSLRKASDNDIKAKGTPSVMCSSDKLNITLTNVVENPPIKIVDILPQRWNHLVFVYADNVAHFYLNSKLMFSEPLTNNLPTYSFSDELVSGDETGIIGKIGGVTYVPTTYSAQQIAGIYNATRGFYV